MPKSGDREWGQGVSPKGVVSPPKTAWLSDKRVGTWGWGHPLYKDKGRGRDPVPTQTLRGMSEGNTLGW